jgi:hypothetical protein
MVPLHLVLEEKLFMLLLAVALGIGFSECFVFFMVFVLNE